MRVAGAILPVTISDLSASGALVSLEAGAPTFETGTQITLLLDEFGAIEARVVHVGNGFYGLSFLNPHLHRDQLTEWLRQEVGAA